VTPTNGSVAYVVIANAPSEQFAAILIIIIIVIYLLAQIKIHKINSNGNNYNIVLHGVHIPMRVGNFEGGGGAAHCKV